jgi:hypothetical protein
MSIDTILKVQNWCSQLCSKRNFFIILSLLSNRYKGDMMVRLSTGTLEMSPASILISTRFRPTRFAAMS